MENKIAARYLNSCFLGHATADIMKDYIVKYLTDDGLSFAKMIMLSGDGLNVNKSLKNKLVDAQKALGCPSLVDINSCNLHTIHNTFKTKVTSVSHYRVLKNFLLTSFITSKIFHLVQRIKKKFMLLSIMMILTINLCALLIVVASRYLLLLLVCWKTGSTYVSTSYIENLILK